MIGQTGRILSNCNLTNMMLRECLVLRWLLRRMMLFFTLCGHTPSKPWMAVKRLAVFAMAPLDQAWFEFLRKPTPTVSTKQVLACSTLSLPQRTYLFMAQMSLTRLPKLLHQNRDFSSAQIVHLTNGGLTTKRCLLSLLDTSFRYYQPCRAILNPHDSGKNMLTRFYAT